MNIQTDNPERDNSSPSPYKEDIWDNYLAELIRDALNPSVYMPAGVDEEPEITMDRWTMAEATDKDDVTCIHVYGRNLRERSGRASSEVKDIYRSNDGTKLFVKTLSGRVYELFGPPGKDSNGSYVWNVWKRANHIVSEKEISDVHYPPK